MALVMSGEVAKSAGATFFEKVVRCALGLKISTKARGVENRPAASSRGTPKSLCLKNHTKSQRNARNSLKVLCVIEKKQI